MKRRSIIIVCALLCLAVFRPGQAKDKKEKEPLRLEIECATGAAGFGVEGRENTNLIFAWVYVEKADVSIDVIKEAAVRGILFRGYGEIRGCQGQSPLVATPNAEQQYADFFNAFFAPGGKYLEFATTLTTSLEVFKLSKKEYKVGMPVSVARGNLRKYLEAEGIVKKLDAGF
ncbi:MAG: hypothetical protein LBQ78_05580 [Tannerellaceae bacterium]|jgi:hypothetical protein|nr:hypothetical protein [Tannerellaceae bacterium]